MNTKIQTNKKNIVRHVELTENGTDETGDWEDDKRQQERQVLDDTVNRGLGENDEMRWCVRRGTGPRGE